jgi:8-oxo-dGTP pyrophosphatase MutT (NUDIX family)
MKNKAHVGNVTLIVDKPTGHPEALILLGRKRPKRKSDDKRKRKKVGSGLWVPPGGGTKISDRSQKHGARREVQEETGLLFPLHHFHKVGILKGFFDGRLEWIVHLYMVTTGDSAATLSPNEEYTDMRWFPVMLLPFDQMLPGDEDWMPRILKGQKLSIQIYCDGKDDLFVSSSIKKINSFN